MKHRNDNLEDRLKAARDAKAAMLKRIASRPGADDPVRQQKKAERQAILAAREIRRAESEQKRQAERDAQMRQAEADALLQLKKIEQDAIDTAHALERAQQLAVEQKAARDARYAARKARK